MKRLLLLAVTLVFGCAHERMPPPGVSGRPEPRADGKPPPAKPAEPESVHQPVEALAMPFASKKRKARVEKEEDELDEEREAGIDDGN